MGGDLTAVATAVQARATAEADDARDLRRHLRCVARRRRLEPLAKRPAAEELWDIYYDRAWPARAAEISDEMVSSAVTEIEEKWNSASPPTKGELIQLAEDLAEELGRDSSADPKVFSPKLADATRFEGAEYEALAGR